MFTHHCSACDRTQLIFASQIVAVDGTPAGAVATFTCWCGATQESHSDFMSAPAAPVSPTVYVPQHAAV